MIYSKKPGELVTNFQFNWELVIVINTLTNFSPATPFFVHPMEHPRGRTAYPQQNRGVSHQCENGYKQV